MECSRARVSTGKPDRRLLKEPRERWWCGWRMVDGKDV